MVDLLIAFLWLCVLLSDYYDQSVKVMRMCIEEYHLVEKKNIKWVHGAGVCIFTFFLYVDIRICVYYIFKAKGWL